jgi:TP901 family phage tail tape measure protein
MVNAAAQFRKNGFNDQDAAQLAKISSMFQNVADETISAGDSAGFIISQLIAFNQTTGDVAANATHIIDSVNEVANSFSVSSGDLSKALGIVASSSGAMGNSMEETLGMTVAITEQTRNATKAARSLNTIFARLSQTTDENSDTGKALVAIYDQLGISLTGTDGQLRSSFDILTDLSKQWGNLDKNTQNYIALTSAGTNQLNAFLALMNNFSHATDAANTALDSQGSAMRENSAYMESIQAKLSQLQSTFQDFANNVITSDLAKAVLDLANGLLQIANTDLGQIVTQIVLLTGLGWGATSLTKALGIFKVGIEQFKNLAGVITGVGAAGSITLPIILGIASVLAVGGALWKATEDSRKSFVELETEIGNTNDKLQANKERLKEISDLPWNERTQEILDEKEALEKENDELQAQIDKLETLSEKKAKQSLKGGYVTGERIQVSGITGEYAGRFDSYLQDQSFETYEELVKYLDNYIPGASKKTREELEALGVQFETVQGQVYKTGEAYEQDLIQQANELSNKLKTNHQLTDEDLEQYNEVTSKLDTLAQAHQLVGDESTAARDALDGLNSSYKNAVEYTQKYGDALIITDEQAQQLIKTFPVLKDNLQQTNEGWMVLETTVGETASALISADGRIKKSSKDRVASTLANIKAEVEAYKELYTITLYQPYSNTDPDYEEKKRKIAEAKKGYEASAAALVRLQQAVAKTKVEGYYDDTPKSPTSPTSTTKTTTKKATDLALEEFKNLQKDLEHQKELGLIKEEEYYDKLEQLVKDYKAKATAHMKEYGTDVDTINRNMYQYEEEIYKGRAKLVDNWTEQQKQAAEKAAADQKAALEQQRSDYEKAVNYIISKIDEQISKLEQQKSDIEKFYDDQIQALQDTNDELERQIQYEQLLNNLAQAKDKGLYVFSNGQFQYMQDVEAISAAQAELDAYERDEALRKEVENLNKLKDQATASIDAQIEKWEEYKEEWSNVVAQYDEEQNKLLASQLLGIDAENANWETRLANAQNFVNKYNSIMAGLSGGSGVSASSGDGYSFSGSGSGGWTEAEMKAGFISSSSSSKSSRKSVDSMRSEANAALAKSKATGKKVSLGGGVSIDYSKVKKHAGGTLSAQAGLSLVGEQGPELRVLGQGDGVIPADVTRNLWDWGKINPSAIASNMNNIFNIDNLILPNARDAQTLIAGLKQMAYQRAYKRA